MGEAARRRALGLPPRFHRCPVVTCRSKRVRIVLAEHSFCQRLAKLWDAAATDHGVCLDCRAFWEALPPLWRSDCVERAETMGPCDNCAWRASSVETRDPEQRAALLSHAEEVEVPVGDGTLYLPRGRFCCHKGIPIKIGDGSLEYDWAAAGIKPEDQPCSGWLRVLWAKNGAKEAAKIRRRSGRNE